MHERGRLSMAGGVKQVRPGGAAPSICWLWALAFAGLAWVAYDEAPRHFEAPPSVTFTAYNQPRIEAFGLAGPGAGLRVVSIGNSRLKYATPDDGPFARLAATAGLERASFLRIIGNWAVFEDFEPLVEDLLALEPDVIVLQVELLGVARAHRARRMILGEFAAWQLLGLGPWNPLNVNHRAVQTLKPCLETHSEDYLKDRLRLTDIWVMDDSQAAGARRARDFVRRAAAVGTQVALVTVPMSASWEALHPSDRPSLMRLAEDLGRSSDNVHVLRYPVRLSDDRYCDPIHMNPRGGAEYSDWLIGELARLRRPASVSEPWRRPSLDSTRN